MSFVGVNADYNSDDDDDWKGSDECGEVQFDSWWLLVLLLNYLYW